MNQHQEQRDILVEQPKTVEKTMPVVLVLEDEVFIGIELEAALSEVGFDVTLVHSCTDAAAWLTAHRPAAAILDVKLRDGDCVGIAEILTASGIPFALYTGDNLEGDHAALQPQHVIYKPAAAMDIVEIVQSMVASCWKTSVASEALSS